MPAPIDFAPKLEGYLHDARAAQAQHQHHDYRRTIFLTFIQQAFGIAANEIDIERYIRIDVRRKGWIDALFRDVVFEFKRNLTVERADGLRELRDYLRTLADGAECVGLLTDGLQFEVYRLEGDSLSSAPIDTFDLSKHDAEAVFLWLDAYLFSQRNTPPTSADMVRRFGLRSPTFQAAARVLGSLLQQLSATPALDVKRQQWRSVLAKVYGSADIVSDALFVRHTFLNQFAKLLAYSALAGIPRDDDTLADIVTGAAFHRWGVSNLGEIDFFAWVLDDPAVRAASLPMLRRLAQSLQVYDLRRINEDLLKQLYQNLVDPETRHDLGEYYTPDWLAELTLEEIAYRPGQSLLDPSCGSGTFLFTAIRRLAAQGMTGWELVDFALDNIAGMDVHPLAVTIARTNYLLAITPHMRGPRTQHTMELVPLPVYMADALLTPESVGQHKDTLIIPVDRGRAEEFHIPVAAANDPSAFSETVDLMQEYAGYSAERLNTGLASSFANVVRERFGIAQRGLVDLAGTYWSRNLRLLNRLIHEGRDSIWAYMLKNTSRPLLLAAQKFDVIAGNPPWLSYRYIKDKTYQSEVKALILRYGLLDSDDVNLFTQMDLSTLFMVHCETHYLKPDGLIAFVMPRSVITGAKQHRRFQSRGLTRVLDLLETIYLFNVPSIVAIRRASELHRIHVPTTRYLARIPQHSNLALDAVQQRGLTAAESTSRLVGDAQLVVSPYYERFKQGATLVPRNLCFVRPVQQLQPGDTAFNPAMESDPDADAEAKAPWKGVRLEGLVDRRNLYATLLSKNVVPFGSRKLHLVALPVQVVADKLRVMSEQDFLENGSIRSWRTWFAPAENKWDTLKKDTSQFADLIDRYNYQRTLTVQQPYGVYKVLYNTSGVHLVCCVIDTRGATPKVYEYPTQGFIVDTTTYCFDTDVAEEAYYLCALLNAPYVDDAIKAFQARGKGIVGQRHIHRTPFEACAIPPFDSADPDHLELARLSRSAHEIIAQTALTGEVVRARRDARAAVAAEIAAIDAIARRVLGIAA
jgi:hypothetical protein